jgi:hypothetical protein
MKIVIDATLYPDETIKRSITAYGHGNDIILLTPSVNPWKLSDFGNTHRSLKFVSYPSFSSFGGVDPAFERAKESIGLVHQIINDHNTLLLSNRYGSFGNYGPGIFHYIRYLTAFVTNVLQFLEKEKPDLLFFRSTPHSLQEWPFALVAEYLGIPVLLTERSVIPWRLNLNSGFKKQREIIAPPSDLLPATETERQFIEKYYKDSQSSYDKVIPLADKRRLARNKNKIYNFKNELKYWWKRPDKMYNKYKCYQACMQHSVQEVPGEPYFAFFMHYQPERTSMPEGYGFSQQMLAIQALRIALPKDVALVVKEHPSTFTNQCTIRERHPSFYEDIARLQGVTLIDVGYDTFRLMDNAVGVATITGTAGRQAMLRNKPVVFFGRSIYNGIEGTHEYRSMDELTTFVTGLDRYRGNKKILENIWKEMEACVGYSFTGFNADFDLTTNYFERKLVLNASEKALDSLLQNKITVRK